VQTESYELAICSSGGTRTVKLPCEGELSVGRDPSNVLFIDDPSVSRRHAISRVGATLEIEDLGGPNGTFLRSGADANITARVLIHRATPEPGVDTGAATSDPDGSDLAQEIKALERTRIIEALGRYAGNQSEVAKALGISRTTLISRLQEFGPPRPRRKA